VSLELLRPISMPKNMDSLDERLLSRQLPGDDGARRCIAYLVGARPNLVKMAPVFHELRLRLPAARHLLVHTGQHYDREMSEIFFEELDLPEPDFFLGVGSGSHGAQTARAIERIEAVLVEERPDLLIVAGDVNSTLAGAVAASKLLIPIAHVEAGLRSFDRTMPEEINRILVDQVSDWCFIHSPEAVENLQREGVGAERIFFVGNTMIDTLERVRYRIDASDVHDRLGLVPGRYVLATLHRPRVTDGPLLAPVVASLARVSRELPVVFPVHPRTQARLADVGLPPAPDLRMLDPVGYIDFLALEAAAAAVITDSGGVQEETTYLGVPCFTLRENTERPITILEGTNRLLGLDPEGIERVPSLLAESRPPAAKPEGWDGRAAARIADVVVAALGSVEPATGDGDVALVSPADR
jgi:UDP-N-acetylglucosamine 2-epimerase (non-hydrolysing)